MSFMETSGSSGRFRTRAQNCAITMESAPRSSKKLLSADTRSTPTTPASTSVRFCSIPAVILVPPCPISAIEDSTTDPSDVSTYSPTRVSPLDHKYMDWQTHEKCEGVLLDGDVRICRPG